MAQTLPPIPPIPPIPSPTSIRTPSCDQNPRHDQHQHTSHLHFMVLLAAIFCAFVCALGLNSMLHCIFQCANRALTEPVQWVASRRLNSGLKKKEMVALPTSTYNADSGTASPSSSSSGCAICLADFCDGDRIRVLPKCNHRFHVACIDGWLLGHASCPTCRDRLKSTPSLNEIVTT